MEISKTSSINVDYKDRRSPPSWQTRFFGEIILIDKTQSSLHPRIYQLADRSIPTEHQILYWKSGAITISDESFVLIGEALFIDKKKKEILLTNNNTIAYNYLIIASGAKPVFSFDCKKFLAAMQALTDAIRIKRKIPSSFAKCIPLHAKTKSPLFSVQYHHLPSLITSNTIELIAHPHMCESFNHKLFSPDLCSINKRLYEVHL